MLIEHLLHLHHLLLPLLRLVIVLPHSFLCLQLLLKLFKQPLLLILVYLGELFFNTFHEFFRFVRVFEHLVSEIRLGVIVIVMFRVQVQWLSQFVHDKVEGFLFWIFRLVWETSKIGLLGPWLLLIWIIRVMLLVRKRKSRMLELWMSPLFK